MGKMIVDTEKLNTSGQDLLELSKEFLETMEALYRRMHNMPTVTGEWTGKGASEFVRVADMEAKQYQLFSQEIDSYALALVHFSEHVDESVRKVDGKWQV